MLGDCASASRLIRIPRGGVWESVATATLCAGMSGRLIANVVVSTRIGSSDCSIVILVVTIRIGSNDCSIVILVVTTRIGPNDSSIVILVVTIRIGPIDSSFVVTTSVGRRHASHHYGAFKQAFS